MYHVYVLANPDGRIYVGHTKDLMGRLERHQTGRAGWTRHRGPWRLVHHEPYATRSEAMKRERQLKSGRLNQELRAKYSGARR